MRGEGKRSTERDIILTFSLRSKEFEFKSTLKKCHTCNRNIRKVCRQIPCALSTITVSYTDATVTRERRIVSPHSYDSSLIVRTHSSQSRRNLTSHEQSVGVRFDSWETPQVHWNSWQSSGQTVDRIHDILNTRSVPVIAPMDVDSNACI